MIRRILSRRFQSAGATIRPMFQIDRNVLPIQPSSFLIDCKQSLCNPESEEDIVNTMRSKFDEIGLVYLTNTGLQSLSDMKNWANVLLTADSLYHGGANPRKPIEGTHVYDVGAPIEAFLHFHHEMAYLETSPRALALFCSQRVKGKGWTYLSDNIKATDDILSTEFGQKLKDLNICYVRNLTDKEYFSGKDQSMVYNHWQDSFGTSSMDEATVMAESRGLQVEWKVVKGNRFMKTKFYVSAFEYFAPLDRNLLYASVADDAMWFDSWPGIADIPPDDRPLKLTFGDDSEMTPEEKEKFVSCYDKYGFPLKWDVGDIVIICNYRFAHGRPEFSLNHGEMRELGVLIGECFTRIGHIDGKF